MDIWEKMYEEAQSYTIHMKYLILFMLTMLWPQ